MATARARLLVAGLTAGALAGSGLAATAAPTAQATAPLPIARDAAPVVLTGSQLPAWSAPAATGVAQPYPSGMTGEYSSQIPSQLGNFAIRSAHNGTIAPTVKEGVPADEVAAFAWTGKEWREVFDSDDVLLQLRAVQAIVSYLENFRSSVPRRPRGERTSTAFTATRR